MRKIFFIFLSVAFSLTSAAQKSGKDKREERRQRINAMAKQEEEGVITYRKHVAGGIKLLTDGYGAFLEIGRAQSITKMLLFQLEFTERKDPREAKQTYAGAPTSPFIYGKENYFYPIRLGVQQQILLGNKSNKNGVSVTANGGGGITLGLLRPYLMQVLDSTGTFRYVKYNSPDSSLFLNPGDPTGIPGFVGGPDLGKGWSGLTITPGAYVKAAIRFDYGRFNETISALEVGIMAEAFTKKIPIMVYGKDKQFFFNGYVTFMFGSRKN